jgi:lipopolysaccharide transport system ATP-binding protein
MNDIIVRVENLGKRYRIGTRQTTGVMLRDVVSNLASASFRALTAVARRHAAHRDNDAASASPASDHIWALRHVCFDVRRGEIVGIIGSNGAGKSTLLKILSRITEPTEGRVEINGRVGSLLEVGTGFHPELTGRENIYLSGALLGMRKTEIERNLDEIVAFSEIETFIDTPVKHYSSGMYVRLAFSVAAHLEPEILIVDEVLAVGDVAFQRKCLNKMEDVRQHGRTILFVSHNVQAVTRICERALLISSGTIQMDGPVVEVTGTYLFGSMRTTSQREWPDIGSAPGDDVARLRRVRVCTHNGATAINVDIREPVGIEIVFDVLKPGHVFLAACRVATHEGVCAFDAHDCEPTWRGRARPVGRYTSTAWVPGNLLSDGTHLVGASLSTRDPYVVHFFEQDTIAFRVVDTLDGDSARGDWDGHFPGIVRPLLRWTTDYEAVSPNRPLPPSPA